MVAIGMKEVTEGSEIRKDVFAWFGGAAYAAQCLEVELCTLLLLVHRLKHPSATTDLFDGLDMKLSKTTLGGLLRELETHLDIHPEFKDMLGGYLDKRNYLMHHFFFDHSRDILSLEGCHRMIEELKTIHSSLKEADAIAQAMSSSIREHLGISERAVQAWTEAHVREFMTTD